MNNGNLRAKIVSRILWAVVSLWSRSLNVRFVNGEIPEGLARKGQNFISAFWHGSLFLLPHTHRNSCHVIMVSESRDGDIAAETLRHFGFEVVRGSTKRKGFRALIGLINSLRNRKSVAIAVDGPRGPFHKAKQGSVFIAGRLQVPIVPIVTCAKHCWTLEKAWDKFLVPMPFTKGIVLYGEPLIVDGTTKEEIESKRRELETILNRMTRDAATLVAAT